MLLDVQWDRGNPACDGIVPASALAEYQGLCALVQLGIRLDLLYR